ncbi:MAG: DUF420 domain-containing protein [Planctomycetales bacterium]|nr:DUF420 domain-containing protein [Planctomycetales bacterium]
MSGVPLWPTLNAFLNALCAFLLVQGFREVRRGDIPAHRTCMLSALGVSAVFLVSYLAYHFSGAGITKYPGEGAARAAYLALLGSHTVLAVVVVPLAVVTVTLALREKWDVHRRLARVTLPIWLTVSVTGVAVYVWLYLVAGARPPA